MNDVLNKCIRDATEEMFESILGRKVACSEPVEASANPRAYETSVVISFVGGISGAFALRCSRTMAARLASQMLGIEVAEGSDDMKDAIGEFLNMVVGAAKTRYPSNGEPFKISVPTTIIGDSYVLHVKASDSDMLSILSFRCDAETLSIEVHLK